MSGSVKFELELARAFVRTNKKENGLDIELVIDALDSIHRRNEYLKYFYDLFSEEITEKKLFVDRLDIKDSNVNISTRHKYEATAFAFLSNLHEMIDSYPFIYLGVFKEEINNAKYLNWNNLKNHPTNAAIAKMFEVKNSELFIKLDNINNARKHRALPKVANRYKYVEINTAHESLEQYKNLNDLLCELHDNLVPKYIEILNLTFLEVNS